MTLEPANGVTRVSREINARRDALYCPFTDPQALVAWLPPPGMTGGVHAFGARVDGG